MTIGAELNNLSVEVVDLVHFTSLRDTRIWYRKIYGMGFPFIMFLIQCGKKGVEEKNFNIETTQS